MFKKSLLGSAIAIAIAAPTIAGAEIETSAVLKNETAVFFKDDIRTGEATSTLDNNGDGRKIGKFENSAKIFFNGDIGEESSWHGELNLIYDAAAEDHYKGHRNYSQNDWFRELYMDTTAAGWDLRLGKQQAVWGTADGIKLLDIINPTDYRELVQNTMEDSRIPVWMINAERNVGESGNVQFIVAQARSNQIPGLNSNGDSGHAFIMKGVDSVTGTVNGFMNIAPALSRVANTFATLAGPGAGLTGFAGAGSSVNGFATSGALETGAFGGACVPFTGVAAASSQCLDGISQNPTPLGIPAANSNNNVTNLIDPQSAVGGAAASPEWSTANPNSTFEYMGGTSFATFDQYAAGGGMTSRYVHKKLDTLDSNAGFRYRGSTEGGLNYSLNYMYAYDANPSVSIRVKDPAGTVLTSRVIAVGADLITVLTDSAGNQPCSVAARAGASALPGAPTAGAFAGSTAPCTMEFVEEQHRVHNYGASFDAAIDTSWAPLVVRGEFLYQKDTRMPVVDRSRLNVGDMVNGLTPQKADQFKYVIGLDATVMTNLMMSGQFIQFRNLDFVDQNTNSITGAACGGAANCGRYTADPATMHLSNGLQKGWENKEFYSFFLSKPFGDSDLGRWNNIIMYEEGGGYWDRLDAEYSLTDELVVTGEVNMYWGDEDTQFGQFKNSSNVQVGLKYIIE